MVEIQNIIITVRAFTLNEIVEKVKYFTDVVVILASDNVLNLDMRNPSAVRILKGLPEMKFTILAHDRTLVIKKVGK